MEDNGHPKANQPNGGYGDGEAGAARFRKFQTLFNVNMHFSSNIHKWDDRQGIIAWDMGPVEGSGREVPAFELFTNQPTRFNIDNERSLAFLRIRSGVVTPEQLAIIMESSRFTCDGATAHGNPASTCTSFPHSDVSDLKGESGRELMQRMSKSVLKSHRMDTEGKDMREELPDLLEKEDQFGGEEDDDKVEVGHTSSSTFTSSSTANGGDSTGGAGDAEKVPVASRDYGMCVDDAKLKLYMTGKDTRYAPYICHRDARQFYSVLKELMWVGRMLWSICGGWTLLAIKGRWIMLWKPADIVVVFLLSAASNFHKAHMCLPPQPNDIGPKLAPVDTLSVTWVADLNIELVGDDLNVKEWEGQSQMIINRCDSQDFANMVREIVQCLGPWTSTSPLLLPLPPVMPVVSTSTVTSLPSVDMSTSVYIQQQKQLFQVGVLPAFKRCRGYNGDHASEEQKRYLCCQKIAIYSADLNKKVFFKEDITFQELEEMMLRLEEEYLLKELEKKKTLIYQWDDPDILRFMARVFEDKTLSNGRRLDALKSACGRVNAVKRKGRNSIRDCGESPIGCENLSCKELNNAVVSALVNFLRADTSISDYHKRFVGAGSQYPGSFAQ